MKDHFSLFIDPRQVVGCCSSQVRICIHTFFHLRDLPTVLHPLFYLFMICRGRYSWHFFSYLESYVRIAVMLMELRRRSVKLRDQLEVLYFFKSMKKRTRSDGRTLGSSKPAAKVSSQTMSIIR